MAIKTSEEDENSSPWLLIETAICDDRYAELKCSDGTTYVTDLDHDSDAAWWAERGATHWRQATAMQILKFTLG